MNLLSILLAITTLTSTQSIYDFSFKTLDEKEVKMSEFKGKKILIFNSASKCGYTPQLAQFEELHQKYGSKLVIIGFPSNEFLQEKKDKAEIGEVCYGQYKVTFLMADKVKLNGDGADPIFKWLTSQENPDFAGDIKWNFEKFLIDENGKLIHRWRSKVTPMSSEITSSL